MNADENNSNFWIEVGALNEIPERSARIVRSPDGDIAVFKSDDGAIFSVYDRCPHKGGPLSQGIVSGRMVACPLHNWIISLESGQAQGADVGCAHIVPTRIENGRVFLSVKRRAAA